MYHYAGNNPVKYTDPDGREVDKYGRKLIKGVDINLNPKSKESPYERAASHLHTENTFVVAGHGNRNGIYEYFDIDPNSTSHEGKGVRISPKELAKRIKRHPRFSSDKTVILYSCNVGKKSKNNDSDPTDCYAQQLADELGEGAKVMAPDGYITVGYGNSSNKIERDDKTPGSMKLYLGREKDE